MAKENCRKLNMKRKVFAPGKKQNFKRFKRTPQYIKDNLENKIAREKEKDPYLFTDSEDDGADDLGMGLEISDLPILDENIENTEKLIAFTQDSVRPFFSDEASYDESKLDDALAELKYKSFRPNQKETIKRILFGRSTLFVSPTGSGKSLCYQLPALIYSRYRNYITIVISPLISLMEDQISTLPKCLKAVSIHSNQSAIQKRHSISQLVNNEAQIVFTSPEAIVGGLLDVDDLKNLPPVGFVCIDEAHCLSEWSHNFRPAYLQFIKILSEKMNIKTFLALTATATKKTAFAIARSLVINPEYDVIGSTTIPDNLILSVSYETNKQQALINLLKSRTFRIMPSIIIYCNRREDTENVASSVRVAMQAFSSPVDGSKKDDSETTGSDSPQDRRKLLSWHAEAYHAGLSADARKRIQKKFIKGEIRVVVATVAFGMGINKSNIRAVIHYDMPGSFESYVQEIGRAGRDGQVAQCHMFLNADRTDLFYQLRNIYSSIVPRMNLAKIVKYIFKQTCSHVRSADDEDREKLDRLNKLDPPHQSIIKKHRLCKGHEVAVPIDEVVEQTNLWSESIMTILCKIQQAYPQILVKQLPTFRANCTISCKTPEQLQKLAEQSRPVKTGIFLCKKPKGEISRKVSFDVIQVASILGKSSADVVRMIRKLEWELVDATGKFRRSHVRINFDGNSFHMVAASDLTNEEMKEVEKFLIESNQQYETRERERMTRVYDTFRSFSIPVSQMNDKKIRLDHSDRLKAALNNYFDPAFLATQVQSSNDNTQISAGLEDSIRSSAKAFLSFHEAETNRFTPAIIAKIFQGISTPNHPAQFWGPNRKWWRKHVDVDFKVLCRIIGEHMQ